MRAFVLLSALFASAARAGVIVGHPVTLQFAPGAGLAYTSGSISVTDEVVHFCNGSQLVIPIDDVLAVGDTVLLPAGTICGVELVLDGATLLAGTGTSGGSFTLQLNVPVVEIDVDPPVFVASNGASDAEVLELGAPNFVTASLLQLGPGITRNVTPASPLHSQLAASVRYDSSILE